MGFWKKVLAFIIILVAFTCLQLYGDSIGRFEFSLLGKSFSLDLYLFLAVLTSVFFSVFILKSFLSLITKIFYRRGFSDESESIKLIAHLILSDDSDFLRNIDNFHLVEKFKVLRTALILKRNIKYTGKLEPTFIGFVDIHILKNQLLELITVGDHARAIDLAKDLIKNYAKYLYVVQEELLNIAIIAKKSGTEFLFDPSKRKYNLQEGFADRYFATLDLVSAELESNDELKLRILEKAHKNHRDSPEIAVALLDFAAGKYEDKKFIDVFKQAFKLSPDRRLVQNLFRMKRHDAFELAQEITSQTADNNVEKLWFLLMIAMSLDFISKVKELIGKIIEFDKTDEISNFYVKHQDKLANDSEILNLLRKKIK